MQTHLSTSPPYRKLLLRFTLASLLPLTTLLALQLFWGYYADHRLAAIKAHLTAQGVSLEPPTISIPHPQNAAIAIISAADAFTPLSNADRQLLIDLRANTDFDPIPWTDDQKIALRQLILRKASVFEWINVAHSRPSTIWPQTQSPRDHPWTAATYISRLLFAAATLAQDEHHGREALEDLRLLLTLAHAIEQDPWLGASHHANDSYLLAASAIERFEPTLRLSPDDGSLDAASTLLPFFEHAAAENAVRANVFENETRYIIATQNAAIPGFWQWCFHPLFTDQTSRILETRSRRLPSEHADNFVDARAFLPNSPPEDPSLLANIIRSSDLNLYDVDFSHFRTRAACAAATVLLAAAIQRAETGHYPSQSQDLVPHPLARIPTDPFAADHRPMSYRLDPAGPTLWSIAENGVDDGGHVSLSSRGLRIERFSFQQDHVFGAEWIAATHAPDITPSPPTARTPTPAATTRPLTASSNKSPSPQIPSPDNTNTSPMKIAPATAKPTAIPTNRHHGE